MALVFKDRIKETTATTGQGTITLAGAVDGFRSFADIGNSNTTYYVIYDNTAYNWEVGIGTYTASGTTLSRDTVLQTSAGNTTKINFGVGSKEVFVSSPAGKHVYLDDSNNLNVGGTTYLNAIHNRWTKTATSGQTVFSGTDASGGTLSVSAHTQVFINGILLEASDYTIGGTTTVTLASGASASDIVEIISFAPFTTALALQPSNNLSDLASVATARSNLNVADGANNYVHPNHSGEVTSTADGATVIANDVVDEANLKVSNTPTNNYFLQAQSGDAGGLRWSQVDLSGKADLSGATFSGDISGTNATLSGYLRGPASFTIDPASHGDATGTVVIAGSLQVDGTTTTINSTTVAIDDLNFSIATDASDSATANGAGITIGGAGATLTYTHADTSWNMNKPLNVTGAVTATTTINAGSNGGFYLTQDSSESVIRSESQPIVFQTYASSAWNDRLTIANSGAVTVGGSVTANNIVASGASSSFNSGATNTVATFTSTDSVAGIQLVDNAGSAEITAEGNTFQVRPAGGVAVVSVTANNSDFATDVNLKHDGAVLSFGADSECTLTHEHNQGLKLNSSYLLYFNGTNNWIHAPSANELTLNGNTDITFDIGGAQKLALNGSGASFEGYIDVASDVYFSTANHRLTQERGQNVHLKTGTSGNPGLLLTNSSDGDPLQLYSYTGGYGFLASAWGSWDIQKAIGDNLHLNNDSSYYLNPPSTTKLNTLNVTGLLKVDGQEGSSGQILRSNGGSSPTWADPSSISGVGGGWEFVSGVNNEGTTVASTVEFTGLERNRQYKLIIYKWYVDVSDTHTTTSDYKPLMQFYNDSYGWNKNAGNGTLKFRFESRYKTSDTNTWTQTNLTESSSNALDGVWLSNQHAPTRNNALGPFWMEIDFGQHTNADFGDAKKYELAWQMKGSVGSTRYECSGETYANDNGSDDTHFSKLRISCRNTSNNFHAKMALLRLKTS